MAKKKTGKSNLGPEMAKKAYERTLAGVPGNRLGPYDPIWNPNPSGPKSTFNPNPGPERAIADWNDDKPGQVKVIKKKNTPKPPPKPGATRMGTLGTGRGGAVGGLGGGLMDVNK